MRAKTLSYMASGAPVITTPAGIVGIEDLGSVVVTEIKSNSFLKSVIDLLNNFEKSQSLAKKAREIVVKNYTWGLFAQRYVNFYHKTIRNKKEMTNLSPTIINENPFWLEELIAKGRFKNSCGDKNHIYLLGKKQKIKIAINDCNLAKKISSFLQSP
jgi:hypothetical protein